MPRTPLLPRELRGPNLAALIAEEETLIAELGRWMQKARKHVEGLRALQARTDPTARLAARRRKWKLPNGTHLSDSGKAKILQKIAEDWPDYQIAKLMGISAPAVKPYRTAAQSAKPSTPEDSAHLRQIGPALQV